MLVLLSTTAIVFSSSSSSSSRCFLPNNRRRNLVVSFLKVGPSCYYHHQISGFRVWRRPRLKKFERKLSSVVVSSSSCNNNNQLLLLGPLYQFDDLFKNLISQFPFLSLASNSSLDLIAPALGLLLYLAAATTPTNTTRNSDRNNNNFEEEEEELSDTTTTTTGEWILLTSPTSFNRFVMLGCPSILFQGGGELLLEEEEDEDVNEKLVKEERQYVRIQQAAAAASRDLNFEQKKLVYQRVCVSTDDGGVISIVMNPRGCADFH